MYFVINFVYVCVTLTEVSPEFVDSWTPIALYQAVDIVR